MRKILVASCSLAFAFCVSVASAKLPDPIVISVDGHDYVSYGAPVVLSLAERLAQSPEAQMRACRRSSGEAPLAANFRLQAGDGTVDAVSMRVEFHPTRLVLATPSGDVSCGQVAGAFQTGIGRVFVGDFEFPFGQG